jgi:hypothetical protein
VERVVVDPVEDHIRHDVDFVELQLTRWQLVTMESPGLYGVFSEDTAESSDLLQFVLHGRTVVLEGAAFDCEWKMQPGMLTSPDSGVRPRCAPS